MKYKASAYKINKASRVRFIEIEDKELFFESDTPEDCEYALKWRG